MVLINSKIITTLFALLCIYVSKVSYSQEIDVDDLLDRLERIERNISDIQKGKFDSLDKSLSSGYISRNEKRIDQIETNLRQNFGTLEEIQNQINLIGEKLDLINEDFQSRVLKLEKDLQVIKENKTTKKENKSSVDLSNLTGNDGNVQKSIITNPQKNLSEQEIKKKYENAIKLLWASKFEEAEVELVDLKKFNPEDLMPNIQYWLGEVHYAQKKFEKAILEFGEGLQKYPDSIKGCLLYTSDAADES